MVSDKAEACPHCGCPVEKTMICPECGYTVSTHDAFCQNCGHPIERPVVSNEEEVEETQNSNKGWIIAALAALAVIGAGAGVWYHWMGGHADRAAPVMDSVAVDSLPSMIAPVIELDADGMYSFEDCPTTYDSIEIVKHKGEYHLSSIDVMLNGKLNCSFDFVDSDDLEKCDYVTGDQIHYLDANFDGYVDFLVGPCCSREYSALFIWEPKISTFVRVTENGHPQLNGNYKFHPASQRVYSSGSSSFSSNCTFKMSWNGTDLKSEEELYSEMLKSRLDEDQPARYVIRQGNHGRIILSTDNPEEIPSRWKKWAYIPTPEEEAQYDEGDSEDVDDSDVSYSDDETIQARGEMIEIEEQIQREKAQYRNYYQEYRSLMQQYGTTSPNPYLYDNLMGVINRVIELSDRGEKLARQIGNDEMAENYRKDARMCRNAKNQLIMQH